MPVSFRLHDFPGWQGVLSPQLHHSTMHLPPHMTPVALDKAFRLLNHGPTVLVSARHGGVSNVMAAAWVCVLDYAPPRLTVVLDKSAKTRELVEQGGGMVIQVPNAAQVELTQYLGSHSWHDEPGKLAQAGAELFEVDGVDQPFVAGCSAWLACELIPEAHNQQTYDLFIANITAAWADARVFHHGRWHFETADPALRSLHHVSGGHYYAIGEALERQPD